MNKQCTQNKLCTKKISIMQHTTVSLKELKKLFKSFEFVGNEELFTNYCFNYGVITADYRNETERNTIFNICGVVAEVVVIKGCTNSIKLKF